MRFTSSSSSAESSKRIAFAALSLNESISFPSPRILLLSSFTFFGTNESVFSE